MTHTLFRKSQKILEFIDKKPLRAHLVTYLSENFSLEDEGCAVGVIQLARDGTLHCVAASGFVAHDPMAAKVHDIYSLRPTSRSVRDNKLKILSVEEMSPFLEYLPEADRQRWRTGVTIPIGMALTYFFFLKEDATIIDDYFDFISMVAALLNRFESDLIDSKNQKGGNWFRGESKELTERESQIESFIKEGLTNAQIAERLGYSESLIRQETVSIYRKLGVSGRKELLLEKLAEKKIGRKGVQLIVALAGNETLAPFIGVMVQSQQLM